jgi:outer membrane protein
MKTTYVALTAALALLLSVTLCPVRAEAQAKTVGTELKIGVVDIQAAVAKTKEGQEAQKKLEALGTAKRKELDEKTAKIKAMEEELKKQLPLMNEKVKQEKLQAYQELAAETQKLYMDAQNEVATKQSELVEPIVKRLQDIISDVALEYGYTLILNKAAGAVVLYNTPQLDLTDEVVKRYNRK